MGQTWLIASGKGGVGKSTLCAAIGCALAEAGRSVAIMDAAIGLRNQDMLLGLADRVVYDLIDVVEKNCDIDQALIKHDHYENLYLLPAAQFQNTNAVNAKEMRKVAGALRAKFDFVLIDSPSGVDKGFLNALDPADEVLLITTPDDVSMRDAERAAYVIANNKGPAPRLIVNKVIPEWIRTGDMYSPDVVALTLDTPLFGIVTHDQEIHLSLLRHTNWLETPCNARAAVLRIADRIMGKQVTLPVYEPRKNSIFDRLRRKKGESSL